MTRFIISFTLWGFALFSLTSPLQAATYFYDDTVTFAWQSSAPINVTWEESCTRYPIDDDKQLVNIGFTFNFAGTDYTQVRILSNGALHFGADQGFHKDYSNEALPITNVGLGPCAASPADRVIAGYWDDLEPRRGGTVTYETMGTAPNRLFVASWAGVPHYLNSGSYTFQIILYETSNEIKFQYGPGNANGSSATIGVEVSHSDFTQYSHNTGSVTNRDAILFFQAPPPATLDLRLDECAWSGTTNDVLDSSGNSYHGTAVNGLIPSDISPETGGICMAAALDGTDDYIALPPSFPNLQGSFTISAWIRADNLGGDQRIFVDDQSNSGGFALSLNDGGNGRLRFFSRNVNPIILDSGVVIQQGQWHFVTAVHDASSKSRRIYVDAIEVASDTYTGSWGIDNGIAAVGGEPDGTSESTARWRFEGAIDEVLLFPSVLSNAAINHIYTNQRNGLNYDDTARTCGTCSSPLAYYQLDEAFWGVVSDSSGNNNHGAMTGTVTAANIAPAIAGSPGTCGYAEINMNTDVNIHDAIDTGVDVNNAIGNAGTISFWYRSNERRNGPRGDRQLFDASLGNKYFFLVLRNNSRLRFGLEDSNDADFTLDTATNTYQAGTWVHIAATWDLDSDEMRIFLDGSPAASRNINSTGSLGDLDTLYMGDNRSTYLARGSSGNSANGAIDEVRLYNSVQDQTAIQADMNATHPCGAVVDHYVISHSGLAITCEAEPVTITGHDSAHNTITPLSTITISSTPAADGWALQSGTAANFSDLGGGQASYTFAAGESSVVLWLTRLTAAIIDIDVVDGNAVTETTGTATAAEDPALDFRDTGFRFYADGTANTIGTQIAGKESNSAPGSQTLTLRAIQTNTDTMACEARLTGPQTIDMAFECTNPSTCQTNNGVQISGTAIADNPLAGVASYNPVSLDFGATGTATFTLNYADVGQIALHATKDMAALPPDPAITLTGNSNTFTVRPFGFLITTAGNPGAVDSSGAIFTKAGSDFGVTVKAVAWQAGDDLDSNGIPDGHDDMDPSNNTDLSTNTVTPNFGLATTPETVTLTALLHQPAGGNDPALAGTTLIDTFTAGAGSTATVHYDEVGIIEISAAITDGDYLGIGAVSTGNMTGKSGYVGRFTPDHFIVAIADNGSLANPGTNPFTYLGEPFGYAGNAPQFTISAVNLAGNTTLNYTSGFNKIDLSEISLTYPTADNAQLDQTQSAGVFINLTSTPGNHLLTDNGDGTITLTLGGTTADSFSYDRSLGLVAPFNPDFSISLDTIIETTDTVNAPGVPVLITPSGLNAEQRFGRAVLQNTFGPETQDQAMPLVLEYYNIDPSYPLLPSPTHNFFTNDSDVDTSVSGLIPPGPPTSDLGCTVDTGPLTCAMIAVNDLDIRHNGAFTLPAPGIDNTGVLVYTLNLLAAYPWLQYDWDNNGTHDNNPSATATFGIYRGNDRIINWREIIQ